MISSSCTRRFGDLTGPILGTHFVWTKYNIWRSGYLPNFHKMLHLPRKVTLQLHQIAPSTQNEFHDWFRVTYETSFTMRGASKVTHQPHQVLRLPRNSESCTPLFWILLFSTPLLLYASIVSTPLLSTPLFSFLYSLRLYSLRYASILYESILYSSILFSTVLFFAIPFLLFSTPLFLYASSLYASILYAIILSPLFSTPLVFTPLLSAPLFSLIVKTS